VASTTRFGPNRHCVRRTVHHALGRPRIESRVFLFSSAVLSANDADIESIVTKDRHRSCTGKIAPASLYCRLDLLHPNKVAAVDKPYTETIRLCMLPPMIDEVFSTNQ